MSQTFFTADLHLFHANILKYARRLPLMTDEDRARFLTLESCPCAGCAALLKGFKPSVAKMNQALVDNVNARVGAGDRLVLIGDVCWAYGADSARERTRWLLDRLDCKEVHLVWGNHDAHVPAVPRQALKEGEDRWSAVADLFATVNDQVMVHCEDGIKVWCSHYPHVTWPDKHRSDPALHAYGHVHGAYEPPNAPVCDRAGWPALDVGVDAGGRYAPWSARELKAALAERVAAHAAAQVD